MHNTIAIVHPCRKLLDFLTPLRVWDILRNCICLWKSVYSQDKSPAFFSQFFQSILKPTHTVLTRFQVTALLKFYDRPHPTVPRRVIRGYDKAHALRTARMCIVLASTLGHSLSRLRQFEAACLLHDMGRAGLDPVIFGKIWSWAKAEGIPTRPREWRALYPRTSYGGETQAFIMQYGDALQRRGLDLTPEVKDHIEMRLGFARRLKKSLRPVKLHIQELDIPWKPWMEKIMLYYYYPEKLDGAASWIRQLAEILVACEQLEAHSNHKRGKDYYARSDESFRAAFSYLRELTSQHIVSQQVFARICQLTREGYFTTILRQARGGRLSPTEQGFLEHLSL